MGGGTAGGLVKEMRCVCGAGASCRCVSLPHAPHSSLHISAEQVGVAEGRLRKWLLSVTLYLRSQHGGVAQGVALWKRNVDREFEGQEECLICYSIVQPTSGQLPRLACRTCRKRFHGACLYKWFRSSGKSSCPHCQSPW